MNIRTIFYVLASAMMLSIPLSSIASQMNHGSMDQHHNMEMHDRHHETMKQAMAGHDDMQHSEHKLMDHGDMKHGSMNHSSMNQGAVNHKDMDHSEMKHDSMNHDAMNSVVANSLEAIPPSGIAREAGYEEQYVMVSMADTDSLNTACAKASRGMIMLDNASWAKCGNRPSGLPTETLTGNKNSVHSGMHNMDHMDH